MNARKPKSASRRRRGSSRRIKGPFRSSQAMGPPAFDFTIGGVHKFRFLSGSISSGENITFIHLANLMSVAGSSRYSYGITQSLRIRRVALWGPCAAVGSNSFVAIQWYQGSGTVGGSDSITRADSSLSTSEPPSIVAIPKPDSTVGQWHNLSDNQTAFRLWAPVGSIIDVTIEFRLMDDATTPNQIDTGGTGLTPGVFYYTHLDYPAKNWVPVGVGGVLP